jgi:hypothetical protein
MNLSISPFHQYGTHTNVSPLASTSSCFVSSNIKKKKKKKKKKKQAKGDRAKQITHNEKK